MILAPIVRGRKGAYRKELEKLAQDGYVRVRINGELSRSMIHRNSTRERIITIEVVLTGCSSSRESRHVWSSRLPQH